jgi:hypothetical protein
MGGQPFKAVDSISLADDTYSGLSKQVQKLVRSAEYHESYRQKGNFLKDLDTNQWRVEIEYSVIGGVGYNPHETEEFLPGDREKFELTIGLEILVSQGVEEARKYLDYTPKSNDDCLESLKEKGLPETARSYGLSTELLLSFQEIKIPELQSFFGFARKRPPQKSLEKALKVEPGFLYELKDRGLL